MTSGRRPRGRIAAIILALIPSAAGLARQDQQGEEAKPALQTMLVVERGTCADLLVAEKDKELRLAVEMLPARLREFLASNPDGEAFKIPPEAMELLIGALNHPARFCMTNKGFDQQTGMPGIGAVMSFKMGEGGEAEAKAMHGHIEKIRAMNKMPFEASPSKRYPGMNDLPLPVGVLSYGPRHAPDGWRYELIFAAVDDPDAGFAALPPMAEGVNPVLRGSADLAAWSPLISMFAGFAAMASPQGQNVLDQFRQVGLIGPDALKFDWTLGHAADSMRGMFAVRRIGKHAEALALPRGSLRPEDFSIFPADASFASMKMMDLGGQWRNMRKQFEAADAAQFREGYEQVKAALGFDPETEILDALGDTAAMYFSDSTGGGSLLSGVALISMKDPAKIAGAMERLETRVNAMLAAEIKGPFVVEIARFERGGIPFTQLRTPGLPAFMEPTIALVGKWMVVGATAQAATAAAEHLKSVKPGGGLAGSKAFAAAKWDLPGGASPMAMYWVDSARTIRDGYASLTFVSAALANLARTATGVSPARDPGLILPTYADLAAGARPALAMGYWSGDDIIMELRGDRSILVTAASLLGVGDAAPFIGGLVLGAGIGSEAASKHHEEHEHHEHDDHDEHDDGETHEQPQENKKETPY